MMSRKERDPEVGLSAFVYSLQFTVVKPMSVVRSFLLQFKSHSLANFEMKFSKFLEEKIYVIWIKLILKFPKKIFSCFACLFIVDF